MRLPLISLVLCLGSISTVLAAAAPQGLEELQARVDYEMDCLYFPGDPWLPSCTCEGRPVLDVVIVGGGQNGLAAAVALMKLGITNLKILDENPSGEEGPWATFARMHVLRSDKHDIGPALSFPSCTFRAWYEAQHGLEAWKQLKRVPTLLWMDYLRWYRSVFELPVENDLKVVSIEPHAHVLRLICQRAGQHEELLTRKVVLATGRAGFGCPCLPSWLEGMPKHLYAHTTEDIDFAALKGRKVAVIGVGASAFDAAAVAVENGVGSVHFLMRRESIPRQNRFIPISITGFRVGHYYLDDTQRWNLVQFITEHGVPPPRDALLRLRGAHDVYLYPNTCVTGACRIPEGLKVTTNRGEFTFDYVIVGSGFAVDPTARPELDAILDDIQLWGHRMPLGVSTGCLKLAKFPYLGPFFEFRERVPGGAPYLKNIYCFNFAALLSHGWICADIDGISIGAMRLAEGIAADFLISDAESFLKQVEAHDAPLFSDDDLSFLQVMP